MPRRKKRPEKIDAPKKKRKLKTAKRKSPAASRLIDKKKNEASTVAESLDSEVIASGLAPEILDNSKKFDLPVSSPVICKIPDPTYGLGAVDNYCDKVNDILFKPIGNQCGGVQNVPPSSFKTLCPMILKEYKVQ